MSSHWGPSMRELVRSRALRRWALALTVAFGAALVVAIAGARGRAERSRQQLDSAVQRLDALTDAPPDREGRSAIAWGYGERLRLGLESPFRLVEAAARDPRLHPDERRTVSWGLLARVLHGESDRIDPAVLDGMGLEQHARSGEWHLAFIERAIHDADNPRAAEVALRLAYTLGTSERLVDGAAAQLVANVAALVGDREIARREAANVVRSAKGDPVDEVRKRRARRAFYVERPTLLMNDRDVEHEALRLLPALLDSLRAQPVAVPADSVVASDSTDVARARRLYAAGVRATPAAPLAVTVKRYQALVRELSPRVNSAAIERSWNGEMLAAAASLSRTDRTTRRVVGRLLVSSGVAMRSYSQQPLWFPGDSAPTAADAARAIGVSRITFDHDVPTAWRPYFLVQLTNGVTDLRRVFPMLDLASLTVRFRMTPPVDSALAMHDPRTRTLHLPVLTAGGTLTHELAHDLDRQLAIREGHPGYRTDYVARRRNGSGPRDTRVAAVLWALSDEFANGPGAGRTSERPAELFATRVDWFVARSLASRGLSSGFLSGVQDEMLTGHVVHPERLRSGRTVPLVAALQGMTAVAPFAARADEPGPQALLRWALSAPVDRDVAARILRGSARAWDQPTLTPGTSCRADDDFANLVRLAAESRARGWVELRARWIPEGRRPGWARAALGQGPWSAQGVESRVAGLRDNILTELSDLQELSSGMGAWAAPFARQARCP